MIWLQVRIKHDGKFRRQIFDVSKFRIVPLKRGCLLLPRVGYRVSDDEDVLVTDEDYESLARRTLKRLRR